MGRCSGQAVGGAEEACGQPHAFKALVVQRAQQAPWQHYLCSGVPTAAHGSTQHTAASPCHHGRTCATPTATPVAGSSTAPAMPAGTGLGKTAVLLSLTCVEAAGCKGGESFLPTAFCCGASEYRPLCSAPLAPAAAPLAAPFTPSWYAPMTGAATSPTAPAGSRIGRMNGQAAQRQASGRRAVGGGSGGGGAHLQARPWLPTWHRSPALIQCAWAAWLRRGLLKAPGPLAARLCSRPFCLAAVKSLAREHQQPRRQAGPRCRWNATPALPTGAAVALPAL